MATGLRGYPSQATAPTLAPPKTFKRPPPSGIRNLPPGFQQPSIPRSPNYFGPWSKINIPGLGPISLPKPPPGSLGGFAPWAQRILKQHPALRGLINLYEIYELFQELQEETIPGVPGGSATVPGFTKVHSCTDPCISDVTVNWQQVFFNLCTNYTSSAPLKGITEEIPASVSKVTVINQRSCPPTIFGITKHGESVWDRDVGFTSPTSLQVPQPSPALAPVPIPPRLPSIDPFSIPPLQPIPQPQPLPFRAIPGARPNPNRSPSEQPQRYYEPPAPAPNPFVQPRPFPLVPRPGVQPVPDPGLDTPPAPETQNPPVDAPLPGEQPSIQVFPPTRRNLPPSVSAPPGPGVRERKGAIQRGFAIAAAWAFRATEGIDLLEALHDALPEDCQAGNDSTPQEKALALYNCLDQLDLNAAIQNVILNQIEDYIVGTASGRATDAANDLRIILGPAV